VNQLIVQALMGTFLVKVIFDFLAKNVDVLVAENYEVVQAFLLRLYKSLNEGNRIR
jgi:hypothetical protein